MDSERYISVLQDHIVPFRGEIGQFQQYNAPCHTSKLVKAFLEQQAISLFSWPPRSPDLSPIENVWAVLKRKVHALKPSSLPDLHQTIITTWHEDPEVTLACKSGYASMVERVKACKKSCGGYIPY